MRLITIICLLLSVSSLHLRTVHQVQSSQQLRNLLQAVLSKTKNINESINRNLSSLNPYNQQERISSLENIIFSSRGQLLDLYRTSSPPQNSQQYYCKSIPQSLQNDIKDTLNAIKNDSQHIAQIPPINSTNNSLNGISSSISSTAQQLSNDLNNPAVIINSQPKQINQNNYLADKWVYGNQTVTNLNTQAQLKVGENYNVCPIQKPVVDVNGNCMSCDNNYDVGRKQCINCVNYDETAHKCNDVTPNRNDTGGINTNTGANNNTTGETNLTNNSTSGVSNNTNNTNKVSQTNNNATNNASGISNNTSGTNGTNGTSNNTSGTNGTSTNSSLSSNTSGAGTTSNGTKEGNTNSTQNNTNSNIIPNIRVTNSNNLVNLLLPSNTTIQDYKQSLLLNASNSNLLPCPISTPFYDGTACISCSNNQYFSSSARVCLTCPTSQIYNPSTFHCQTTSFYSNPQVKQWTSIGTPSSEILSQIKKKSTQQNSKPCPQETPFFDGSKCISCSGATPIFSYDSMKCTSCISPTIFDPNIYSCTSRQRLQTNPATAPNLILQGRSLNEWKTIYFNAQTADPQIADCPTVKPYFDGVTCINCPQQKLYFNIQYHSCQACPEATAYDAQVKQCLSTSGNIVTQTPSILKMAAGIFA